MVASYILGSDPTFVGLLIEFFLCAAVVLFLATKLSKYADALEQNSKISALWIGAIFLALVTSLPEAVASIGSAVMEGAVNLGVGNLCGSNTFNLLIIVVLDLAHGRGSLLRSIQSGTIIPAIGGIVMMSLVAASIVFHSMTSAVTWTPWSGLLLSAALVSAYVVFWKLSDIGSTLHDTAVVFENDRADRQKDAHLYNMRHIVTRLIVYSVALVGASFILLKVCDMLSVVPIGADGIVLGRTVTGAFVLSIGTSLPELFVCLSAMKLGQSNMAVANVLGSNVVNMVFIPLMHLFSRSSGFYSSIDGFTIIILSVSILMSAIYVVGISVRSKRTIGFLGWDTLAMLFAYIFGAALVIKAGLQ